MIIILMNRDNINIPPSVLSKIGRNLHLQPNHPVAIISKLVIDYFCSLKGRNFTVHMDMSPIVSVQQNFDDLLIPVSHPARSTSDTYYFDENTLLRTHTSAHQTENLRAGHNAFLAIGDVYRKDEIDRSHYPVFHQIEGVYIFDEDKTVDEMSKDLIDVLIGLCHVLFPECETRTNTDYFPFTHPSYEVEVFHKGKWIEILGCGIVQPAIIESCSKQNITLIANADTNTVKKGWAFGIGLDRLAMILFEIPDIRMMWVTDEKFTSQFEMGKICKFTPYSMLDPLEKDTSFWIPDSQIECETDTAGKAEDYINGYRWKNENDMSDMIREVANSHYSDIVESVVCFDQFYHPKKHMWSRSYRIKYSVPDPEMNNGAHFTYLVNSLHAEIATILSEKLNVIIR
jgi:phenylalanyl-tRNA synthetase alpha chain